MSLFFSSLFYLSIGILIIKYQTKKRVTIEEREIVKIYKDHKLIRQMNINNCDTKSLLSDSGRDSEYDEDHEFN